MQPQQSLPQQSQSQAEAVQKQQELEKQQKVLDMLKKQQQLRHKHYPFTQKAEINYWSDKIFANFIPYFKAVPVRNTLKTFHSEKTRIVITGTTQQVKSFNSFTFLNNQFLSYLAEDNVNVIFISLSNVKTDNINGFFKKLIIDTLGFQSYAHFFDETINQLNLPLIFWLMGFRSYEHIETAQAKIIQTLKPDKSYNTRISFISTIYDTVVIPKDWIKENIIYLRYPNGYTEQQQWFKENEVMLNGQLTVCLDKTESIIMYADEPYLEILSQFSGHLIEKILGSVLYCNLYIIEAEDITDKNFMDHARHKIISDHNDSAVLFIIDLHKIPKNHRKINLLAEYGAMLIFKYHITKFIVTCSSTFSKEIMDKILRHGLDPKTISYITVTDEPEQKADEPLFPDVLHIPKYTPKKSGFKKHITPFKSTLYPSDLWTVKQKKHPQSNQFILSPSRYNVKKPNIIAPTQQDLENIFKTPPPPPPPPLLPQQQQQPLQPPIVSNITTRPVTDINKPLTPPKQSSALFPPPPPPPAPLTPPLFEAARTGMQTYNLTPRQERQEIPQTQQIPQQIPPTVITPSNQNWANFLLILSSIANLLFTIIFSRDLALNNVETSYKSAITLIIVITISIIIDIFLVIAAHTVTKIIAGFSLTVNLVFLLFYVNWYSKRKDNQTVNIYYVNVVYGAFNLLLLVPNIYQVF